MASPAMVLFAPSIALWIGAQSWRRKRLKRAAGDLPTKLRRLLGPEPDYLPPEGGDASPEMADYAKLHRKTGRVANVVGLLACLWLLFVAYLALQGHALP